MTELSIEQQEAIRSAELGGLKKKLNAASWSDHMEDLMKAWGEKAAGLRWMHNQAAGSWKGFSDKLALTGIVLTTLSSAAAFGGAGGENEQIVMYVLGGMGLAASLVQSLKKFYQADEKAAEHSAIAKQFGSFYRAMTLELGMGREDRRPSEDVTGWASREYDRMQQDAPSLGGGIIKIFRDNFKHTKNIPDIAESNFEIKIYGRDDREIIPSQL
jgi:hypothetical protein